MFQDERGEEAHAVERAPDRAPFERLDVDDHIGQFGHRAPTGRALLPSGNPAAAQWRRRHEHFEARQTSFVIDQPLRECVDALHRVPEPLPHDGHAGQAVQKLGDKAQRFTS